MKLPVDYSLFCKGSICEVFGKLETKECAGTVNVTINRVNEVVQQIKQWCNTCAVVQWYHAMSNIKLN